MLEKSKYKSYGQEFKGDAVLLALDHGYSVSKVAEAVGVRESMHTSVLRIIKARKLLGVA